MLTNWAHSAIIKLYPKWGQGGDIMLSSVNSSNLKAKMKAKGEDINTCARALGLSRQSLYQKVNGERELKCSEVVGLCKILGINPGKEFTSIFFD